MPSTFSQTGGLTHVETVAGLTDSSGYGYYVRCQDSSGNTNTDDFAITFSVGAVAATSIFSGVESPLSENGMWDVPGAWSALSKNNGAYAVDLFDAARLVKPIIGADQYSEITYSQDPGSSSWVGVTTRVQGTNNGSGYLAIAYAGEVRLYRTDDSGSLNFTLLASASAPIGTAPMRLRLESQGSNHRVYLNGVQLINFSETFYVKGQPGIAASVFGGPIVKVLSFAGGAIPASDTTSTYSIAGTITGGGGPGATVSLSGAAIATTIADATGSYSFSGLSNGSYTVTASNGNYVFIPASQALLLNGANGIANFTSATQTYNISGTISGPGGAGATVNMTGVSTATTTADARAVTAFQVCRTVPIP